MGNYSQGKIMLPVSEGHARAVKPTYLLAEDANFTFSDTCNVKAYGGNLFCESISTENAARAVECWNGCIGIANPAAISDVVEAAKRIQAECKIFASWVYSQDIGNEVYGKIEAFDKALSALEGGAS